MGHNHELDIRVRLERDRGLIVPEHMVVDDKPDYFSYRLPNEIIVGWHSTSYVWWRNVKKETL